MSTARTGKTLLSICVCVQLLKIIKFMSALVPKMDLAPSVLAKALPDLIFFGAVFMISMLAFSSMFYVQVPPPARYAPVTRPLRERYANVARSLRERYATVTPPLRHRYATVAPPLRHRCATVAPPFSRPLHARYTCSWAR